MKNTYKNDVEKDLYLRKVALGEIDGEMTGYPSIDKPWLKYYSEEYIKAGLPNMTAYEYLKKQNAERLHYPAIESDFGNYTYGDLFEMIDRTAKSLCEMGIKKGKKILVMLPIMPPETFLFYAVDAVGAALCQLPPNSTIEEICKAIRRFHAELFFAFDFLITPEMETAVYKNECIKNIISINFMPLKNRNERTLSWENFLSLGDNIILPEINRDPSDLLFLASTGGSTGEPKSVMLNDNCFNIAIHQYLNSDLDYQAGDRWMRIWPLFSASAAVANHHLPLCAGMHMLLRQFPLDLSDFDRMIIDNRPNHLVLIPQIFDVLESSQLLYEEDLSYIKTAGCGGLALTAQFEERINSFFSKHKIDTFIGYGWGSTEASATAANRTNRRTTTIGTAGAPMVKNIISAFDSETGNERHYGEEGELCICSPNLMMGYYNDTKTTSRVLRKHSDGHVWLHTGDLGTISEDGIITVKGRMTRVIFVFPTAKIYPQSIESEISKVPGVREVVVCEIPDKQHDGFFLPICFIVPEDGYLIDEVRTNIQNYCEQVFPEYSRPKTVYFKSQLPLTKVGKPDVRALEKEAEKGNEKNN